MLKEPKNARNVSSKILKANTPCVSHCLSIINWCYFLIVNPCNTTIKQICQHSDSGLSHDQNAKKKEPGVEVAEMALRMKRTFIDMKESFESGRLEV